MRRALVCQEPWRAAGWEPLRLWLEALLSGIGRLGRSELVFMLQSFAGSDLTAVKVLSLLGSLNVCNVQTGEKSSPAENKARS